MGLGPIRGRENVIRYFLDQDEMFEEFRIEPERFFNAGDRVLVFVRTIARGRGSGAEVEIRVGHLWTMRQGLAVRAEAYGNRDEALEAAGLSNPEGAGLGE